MILYLVSNHTRGHTKIYRKVIDFIIADDSAWQILSKEVGWSKELGSECTVALLPLGKRPRHE